MTPYEAATRLMAAVDANQLTDVAHLLDEHSVLLTLPVGGHGWTLLHVCAREGRNEVIQLLLERGVPVDLLADGKTALHCAMREGPLNTIQMLLAHGADPNRPTRRGDSPLAMAATGRASAGEDDEERVIELLLRYGAVEEEPR